MTDDRSVDGTIDEMLSLEQELQEDVSPVGGEYGEGTIVDAAKVPTAEVPDGYPVPIRTDTALRIDVETDGGTVPTYIEWAPDGGGQGHLAGLLDALNRRPDEFADVYGDRVGLDHENGFHGIDPDRTALMHGARHASHDAELERNRNLLLGATALGVLMFPVLSWGPEWLGNLLGFLTWVSIPLLVYYDFPKVREHVDWDTDTDKWIAGAAIPFVNVGVAVAYLLDRHVRLSGTGPGTVSDVWYRAVLASAAAGVAMWAVFCVSTYVATMLWILTLVLLPMSVHFDAEYVEDATDWDPDEETWMWATLAAQLFFVGPLAAGLYLLVRHSHVD